MKKFLLPLFMGLLLFLACSDDNTTECIEDRINAFQSQAEWCTGASIIKYEFNGREVYAFAHGQCISDGATSVYDDECNEVCFLGGVAGFTDCEGLNFWNTATQIEIITQVE